MSRQSIYVFLAATGGLWLIAACGTQPAPVAEQPAATLDAAAAVVQSPVSINASMVSIVDHAGHQLWDAEREGSAPKTKQDWENLSEHATQLAAAGALIRVAGSGPRDVMWVEDPNWQKWARAMSDAGVAGLEAIAGENLQALVAANGQLVESCEGCHKAFKPDLPSEGITHQHAHGK